MPERAEDMSSIKSFVLAEIILIQNIHIPPINISYGVCVTRSNYYNKKS